MPPLQSQLLTGQRWLQHGFGTRDSENWLPHYTNLRQIHSNFVLSADALSGCLDQGDALIVREPDNWIGVRTADCVPVLIADPKQRAVASIHAGWRGTLAGIATEVVQRLKKEYGSHPADLLAAIGPCIGPCCFEVGADVASQFGSSDRTLNLPELNRAQLVGAGIPPDRIDVMGLCTVCAGPGTFHSFRRDKGTSGRMVSAICIRDEKSAGEPAL